MGSSASALASGILASLYLEHIIPGYSADMMAMLTLSLAGLGTPCSRGFSMLPISSTNYGI